MVARPEQIAPKPPSDARDEALAREHLHLVRYAVAELSARLPRHVRRDELVSAGMFGLAQALRTYDPCRGVTFAQWARARIRGALLDELRSRDWASRSVRGLAKRVDAATERLTADLGRRPTEPEVAHAVAVDVLTLRRLSQQVEQALVLHVQLVGCGGEAAELSVVATADEMPDMALLEVERRGYLRDAITALPERLRRVVIGYFFDDRPMQDLADELGVSESRVSQMCSEAVALLRDGLNAHLDPELVSEEPRPGGRVARRKAAYYAAIASLSDLHARLERGRTITLLDVAVAG